MHPLLSKDGLGHLKRQTKHAFVCAQGEQPHCGFPEKNYHQNAERLARAGLKVVVVEQTETPDQLRIRNEERKANKQNQVSYCSALCLEMQLAESHTCARACIL